MHYQTQEYYQHLNSKKESNEKCLFLFETENGHAESQYHFIFTEHLLIKHWFFYLNVWVGNNKNMFLLAV